MRLAELRGHKIAVYGLGREGRAMLRVLRRRLPDTPVTVISDLPLNRDEQEFLLDFPEIPRLYGDTAALSLDEFDVVIKSPGISPYRASVERAKARGVTFTSPTRLWFAEHSDCRTVCVTGTKGKSTTTSLILYLLRQAGIPATLGGNIGKPLFELSEEAAASQIWVIELSSYQTSDFNASPTISLILNLFPEHTDWHGDTETYYRDKLNLLTCSRNRGLKLVNYADANIARYLPSVSGLHYFNHPDGLHVVEDFICRGGQRLLPTGDVPLPGAHNLSNVCAALSVIEHLNLDLPLEQFARRVTGFRGLPHRLFMLGEKNGVCLVDDSISTTPQSAMAAVGAFPGQFVTLLLGGYERHLDWHEAARYFLERPVEHIILMGANSARILHTLEEVAADRGHSEFPGVHKVENLGEAVKLGLEITPPGGLLLLSPGSASYGEFHDFRERGRRFAELAGIGARLD